MSYDAQTQNAKTDIVTDLQLIQYYPTTYAKEAFILLRRLAYLKLMITDAPASQHEALDDSKDFEDVICNLIKSKDMTVHEYFRTYYPYMLKNLNSSEEDYEQDDEE